MHEVATRENPENHREQRESRELGNKENARTGRICGTRYITVRI